MLSLCVLQFVDLLIYLMENKEQMNLKTHHHFVFLPIKKWLLALAKWKSTELCCTQVFKTP